MKKRTWILIGLAVLFLAAAIISLVAEKKEVEKEVEEPEPEPEPEPGKTEKDEIIEIDGAGG